jgi:hypothetical protein
MTLHPDRFCLWEAAEPVKQKYRTFDAEIMVDSQDDVNDIFWNNFSTPSGACPGRSANGVYPACCTSVYFMCTDVY